MTLRRTISLLLAIVMLCSMAVVSASAANTSKSATGAYYNQNLYDNTAGATYDGDDLGATYSPTSTTWKVWSPPAISIQLKLYRTGTDREMNAGVIGTYDFATLGTKGTLENHYVWSLTLEGDYKNVYYTYIIEAPNIAGTVVFNETQDIYSKAVGANGDRSMVVDLDSTDPEGWDTDKHVTHKNRTEAAVWELHIRDFSIDADSGVSDSNRGNYLAFTEGGTTYKKEGNITTCIDFLAENNINTVQLMPFADFDGVDEIYGATETERNWGYNPKNYNVPDGSYSSNAYDGNVRINEVKQMIQALHDRGIQVVLDVVYNHTAGYEGSCFNKTVPGYYFRMVSPLGLANGSGLGNEISSDKTMTRNFILQSLKYWADEYHIDGFRFDLMGLIDMTTLRQARSIMDGIDKNILLYGEPWIGGEATANPEQPTTGNSADWPAGVGGFSDEGRKAASRVDEKNNAGQGWLGGTHTLGSGDSAYSFTNTVATAIVASLYDWTDNSKTVNYLECHDDLLLWDKLVGAYTTEGKGKDSKTEASNVNTTAAQYVDRLKMAGILTYTSQGITFMCGGTEFARTKQGQANSYNSSDTINMLKWERAGIYKESVDYYRGLRQIHEVYTPFSDDTNTSKGTVNFKSRTGDLIAYTIDNQTAYKNNEWGKVTVLMNAGSSALNVQLDSGSWVVVANDKKAGVTSLGEASGSYNVPARSGAILVEKTSFNKVDFSNTFRYATLTTEHYLNNELVKTVSSKHRIGTTYRAYKDSDLLLNCNISSVDGTPSGKMTGDTTVKYYYTENGNTNAKLTVEYVDNQGAKLTPDMVYTLESGDKYSIPVYTIQRYQLDTNKYPAHTTGTFEGTDQTITFKYKPLSSETTIVHYYKDSRMNGKPYIYAYTSDGIEPLNDWDHNPKMTADKSLGDGWYTYEVPIASCRVMFHGRDKYGNKVQVPGDNEPGYLVAGECTIIDNIVTFNSTIVTSYIDIETGLKLKDDLVVTEEKKSTDQYTTSSDDNLGTLIETPANASGFYQAGTLNVVYVYKDGVPMPTTDPDAEPQSYILGDSNCDGRVNVNDVTYIQQYLVTLVVFDSGSMRNADVDSNGTVTILDANYIQRFLANIELSYKIGEVIQQGTSEEDTTAPTAPPAQEILFTNNCDWSNVHCYYWFDGEDPEYDWPGEPMDYVKQDDVSGKAQYSVEIPEGCSIIFNNGSSAEQTIDIEYDGQAGFYIDKDAGKNGEGKWKVVGWY